MAEDIDFKEAINMASRMMTANLRKQVPVKTGTLRNSVSVKGSYDGTTLSFKVGSLKYGVYLDSGTGRYKTKQRKQWNPRPGVGKGGIKPRFWMTFEKAVFESMRKRVAKAVGNFIVMKVFRNK